MFIYTKPATKCLTVETEEMHPKLLLKYIKQYMDREDEESHATQTNRIRSSVYPKYVIRYGTNMNNNRIKFFYKLNDVYTQALEDWGNFDMAIQPFIICKSRKASMLRYEVYNTSMVKSFVLSSEYDISSFPYLHKEEIINTRKDFLFQSWNNPNRNKSLDNSNEYLFSIPLNKVNNSELISYFSISTECDEPKVNITSCRPQVYPFAEKMARNLVQAIDSNFISKDFKVKFWIIDFIESIDEQTYLLQIKSFKLEKINIIKRFKRKILKSSNSKISRKSLNGIFVNGLFGGNILKKNPNCDCNIFCEVFGDRKELISEMISYLKRKHQVKFELQEMKDSSSSKTAKCFQTIEKKVIDTYQVIFK